MLKIPSPRQHSSAPERLGIWYQYHHLSFLVEMWETLQSPVGDLRGFPRVYADMTQLYFCPRRIRCAKMKHEL